MNRLRSYRWIEGINQTEMGRLLGISPQLVSAIESGRRSPTCDISLLGYSNFETAEMTEPLHRQRASTLVASTRRAKELLRVAGEAFCGLLYAVDDRHKDRLERLGPIQSDNDIVECANEVRVAVFEQEETGPIKNLTAAVERVGICLVPVVGLKGIDGISSWVGGQPVIGLNINVPGDRFRLSLAHEIAHLVMHTKRSAPPRTKRTGSRRLCSCTTTTSRRRCLPGLSCAIFVHLKSAWGISVAALVYRAHRFGYLDDRSYRSIQIQMSRWRKTEPAPFRPVYGRLLPELVKRHGGVLSCADRLGINPNHLREATTWRLLRAV